MIYRRRTFSDIEAARARTMRLGGATWRDLGAEFDCDYATVRRVIEPGYSEFRTRQISENRARSGTTRGLNPMVAQGKVEIPERVLLDRNRRHAAARSITSMLCGDPAPGQSALDKRRQPA